MRYLTLWIMLFSSTISADEFNLTGTWRGFVSLECKVPLFASITQSESGYRVEYRLVSTRRCYVPSIFSSGEGQASLTLEDNLKISGKADARISLNGKFQPIGEIISGKWSFGASGSFEMRRINPHIMELPSAKVPEPSSSLIKRLRDTFYGK